MQHLLRHPEQPPLKLPWVLSILCHLGEGTVHLGSRWFFSLTTDSLLTCTSRSPLSPSRGPCVAVPPGTAFAVSQAQQPTREYDRTPSRAPQVPGECSHDNQLSFILPSLRPSPSSWPVTLRSAPPHSPLVPGGACQPGPAVPSVSTLFPPRQVVFLRSGWQGLTQFSVGE